MKHTKAMAVVALIILISSSTRAQEAFVNNSARTDYAYPGVSVAGTGAGDEKPISSESLATTNPNLVARFTDLFPAATDARWARINNGFWVSFTNKGHQSTASFTQKGKMNYVISGCELEQLPASFRKTIQKEYAGYKLYNAVEINVHDALAYQAVLENEDRYITLKYTNESIEEIQQLKKLPSE